jgi:hypothetical protein
MFSDQGNSFLFMQMSNKVWKKLNTVAEMFFVTSILKEEELNLLLVLNGLLNHLNLEKYKIVMIKETIK